MKKFWDNVEKTEDCWVWTAGRTGSGYGAFSLDGKVHLAHRFVLRLSGVNLNKELQIDHLCRNRACVKPIHLEEVTARVNLLRGEGQCAKNSRKIACVNGHKFTKANTRYRPSGGRSCRQCANNLTKRLTRERAKREGREVLPSASERTYCRNGHPYNKENTKIRPNGWRYCYTCLKETWRKSNAKRRQNVSI